MSIEQEPIIQPEEIAPRNISVPDWVIAQLDPEYDRKQFQITSWAADIYDRNSG